MEFNKLMERKLSWTHSSEIQLKFSELFNIIIHFKLWEIFSTRIRESLKEKLDYKFNN